MSGNDLVTVRGLFLQFETDRAFGVSFGPCDPVEIWLARSLVDDHGLAKGTEGWAQIPRWLAEKEDLQHNEY